MEIPNELCYYSWDNIKAYIAIKIHSSEANGDILCDKGYIAKELGMCIDDFQRHKNELEALGFIPCIGEGLPF